MLVAAARYTPPSSYISDRRKQRNVWWAEMLVQNSAEPKSEAAHSEVSQTNHAGV